MKPKFNPLIVFLTIGLVFLWLNFFIWHQASIAVIKSEVETIHIINRISFGITPKLLKQIQKIGVEAYIQEQLLPNDISEYSWLNNHLSQFDTLSMSNIEKLQKYSPSVLIRKKGSELTNEDMMQLRQQRERLRQQTIEAHLARAIFSSHQLQEVMVNFWVNHFNVHLAKSNVDAVISDYVDSIRKYSLGNFQELLKVTARHPAMLFYLDNNLNTAPQSPGAGGMIKGLNENYARELMELHTMGVDGGYTQADVIALARIFTGWSVDLNGDKGNKQGFFFDSDRHDYSDKVFLGHTIKGRGIAEGEEALDILANHPSTAHFISYKLAQYFVADRPRESLVNKLAQQFLASEGDIRSVLEILFHSQEFNDPQYYAQKLKTPFEYIVSLVRTGDIKEPNLGIIRSMIGQLGMPVFGCPTPNGYQNTQEAWLNPDSILLRVSFATTIASGALNQKNLIDSKKLEITLNDVISVETKKVINHSPPELRTALMLGSPEMMYR